METVKVKAMQRFIAPDTGIRDAGEEFSTSPNRAGELVKAGLAARVKADVSESAASVKAGQ